MTTGGFTCKQLLVNSGQFQFSPGQFGPQGHFSPGQFGLLSGQFGPLFGQFGPFFFYQFSPGQFGPLLGKFGNLEGNCPPIIGTSTKVLLMATLEKWHVCFQWSLHIAFMKVTTHGKQGV